MDQHFDLIAIGGGSSGLAVAEKAAQLGRRAAIFAAGSEPIVPPLPGHELGITSDGFFALTEQPRRVAIVGGGYIGVELAGVLRTMGSEVTLVAMEERMLFAFDDRPEARLDYRDIPTVVFDHPPVGKVGLTEQEAREEYGNAITVYRTEFTPMRYALSEHPATTAMKLVCVGQEERIVGIHLIGDGADEMLQGFAVVVKMGGTKADLDATVALHPTTAEGLVTLKVPDPPRQEP